MSSTFTGLETALRGVLAHQQALSVSAHNVANASTPGYSRQNPVFQASPPSPAPAYPGYPEGGPFGTGVEIAQVRRMQDQWLAGRLRLTDTVYSFWETQRQFTDRLEAIVDQGQSAGIGAAMDRFWNAWQEVTQNPEDTGVRAVVVAEGRELAAVLNGAGREMRQLASDARGDLRDAVAQMNSLAQGLADLNTQLRVIGGLGGTPNDLLDQRDQLLAELASLADVDVYESEHGAVTVTLGSHLLVEGSHAEALQVPDGLPAQVQWSDGSAAQVSQGEIAGLMRVENEVVPAHLSLLADLKRALVDQVNTLHASGYDLDGNRGGAFFEIGGAGLEVSVSAQLSDPRRLAASADGSVGNAEVARAIAGLRAQPVASLGQISLREHYSAWVTRVGSEARALGDMSERARIRREALRTERESLSGVNLDEEAARMVQWQRAFSASARMLTVMDEMLATVIEHVGLAGR